VPSFKLAQMMAQADDKSSVEYQRLTWDALRKSINGLVNKVSAVHVLSACVARRLCAPRWFASHGL
jgi:pre-mRNA-splicing factor CWC22